MKTSQGFTLIELLVTISIIGLLSSIVLASLSTARNKAYDAKRLSDMVNIRTALEIYRSSNNAYPVTGVAWLSQCTGWGGIAANNVIPGLVPTYLPSMSADPQMNVSTNQNCYIYRSDTGVSYKFLDYNLTNTSVVTQSTFVDPARNYGLPRPPGCSSTEPTYAWAVWSDSVSMCW